METLLADPEQQEAFAQAYHNTTNFTALALGIFLLCAIAVLVVQRRSVLLPFLVVLSLVAHAQRIVVFGIDLGFLRLLLLVGAVRVLARGEYRGLRLHALDVVMITSIVYSFMIDALRTGNYPRQLGEIFDALAMYLGCRVWVRDWGDLDRFGRYAAIVALLIAPFFVYEWITGRNYFSIIGGVPEYSMIHHGRMRAKGAFAHMIIAGCFWGSLIPIMAARRWNPRARKVLVDAGVLAAVAIVFSTASSTPLLGLLASIGAAFLLPIRGYLRWIRWGVVAVIVSLHMVMEKPVWHLLARMGVFGGSTGWHRYNLIDKFFSNFREWALMGTSSTAHWGHNLQDVTNAYILQGVHGGLLSLLLYIAMFVLAFRRMGYLLNAVSGNRTRLAYAWGLGVALFTHAVVHFGVGYFAQMRFPLYFTVAAIGSIAPATAVRRVRRPAAAQRESGAPIGSPAPTTGRR